MEKVKITTAEVLELLELGKSREEIQNHFGLTKPDLKKLFKHPKLKGRKTKKAPGFEIVDDFDVIVISAPPFVDAGTGDREPSMERDVFISRVDSTTPNTTYPQELENREEVELVTAEEEIENRAGSPEWLQ